MNRIDELFIQSGGYIEIDKDGNRWTYSQECDPDTFAELIIEDCLDTISYGGEYVNRVKLIEQLKSHFGIE